MDAPGGDHIATISAHINSLAKATGGVPNPIITATKIPVAAVAGLDRDRLWEAAVRRLQPLQARFANVAVDIEGEDVGRPPGGDADVGVRPSIPPGLYDRAISGGILDAVGGARMLTRMIARLTGCT